MKQQTFFNNVLIALFHALQLMETGVLTSKRTQNNIKVTKSCAYNLCTMFLNRPKSKFLIKSPFVFHKSNAGLEQHEDEWMMTEFVILGELLL